MFMPLRMARPSARQGDLIIRYSEMISAMAKYYDSFAAMTRALPHALHQDIAINVAHCAQCFRLRCSIARMAMAQYGRAAFSPPRNFIRRPAA
jgi:hypothetical protein